MAEKKEMGGVQAVVVIAIAGAGLWFYFGGGLDHVAASQMADIEAKVAIDAVTQYDIAKRNGSAMDRCVQAQMVAAAFLQAKDEPNYAAWKKVSGADCAAAGLPHQ